MSRRPYTTDELAEARIAVTSFDALVRMCGPVEAEALRRTAWDMLAEHRAMQARAVWGRHLAPRDAA